MIYIDDSEPEGDLEPVFPYRDVTIRRNVDANSLYDILGEVGRGKFGTVYRCQEKSSGLKLAAKFVPIPKREDRRNVEREVEIMNSLQHHLIIQLYAAYEHQKMMCVVLELVEGGELFDRVVDDEFVLTERACIVFIRQVCEAMEFIHRNNILHLDLKPENILCLTQEGNRIKIIDFGLARKYDPDKKLQILFGTPEFVAPEVVNFDCISYATDMWSVGVICYVLISGLSPFMGETDIETMANVTIAKYDFEDESFGNVSPDCLNFISKLLVKDMSTRMTASQCLEHKWLQRRPRTPKRITDKPCPIAEVAKMKGAIAPPILSENVKDFEKLVNNTPATPTTIEGKENELETAMKTGKELESTKDNLKNFIERWEEHPNSPYVFDVESNVITPMNESSYDIARGLESVSSSRVCSPSPCESIETLTDEEVFLANDESPSSLATPVNESREKLFPSSSPLGVYESPSEATTPTPQKIDMEQFPFNSMSKTLHNRSLQGYLHTFDRRNSDTNYLLGRRSSGERVNLADEIRKLSDHLLMLAKINNKLGAADDKTEDINNNQAKATSKGKTTKTSKTSKATTSKKVHESSSSTSSSSKAASSSILGAKTGGMANSWETKSKLSRLQQSIDETPTLLNGWNASTYTSHKNTISTSFTSNTKSFTSSVSSTSQGVSSSATSTATTSSNETAKTKRAKFRITQMSRDVPIGLPDTHQTVNLEEAANTTKDCLLHLLEKYNENSMKARNPLARHQSISVDWHISDNLEYRSMSSINAFFQRHSQLGDGKLVKHLQAQLESKSPGK